MRVGIDLGGTKLLGVAIDEATGELLATHQSETPRGGAEIVAALAEMAVALEGLSAAPAVSIGVGAAGLVDERGILRFAPNLPGVIDLDLPARLGERLGRPVAVDNDVTCSALAEHRLGAAKGVADAVVVALGTGIGGAVVSGGTLRRGAHHMAGEFGHMLIDPAGPQCGCGKRGCWEQMASGNALGRLTLERAREGRLPGVVDRAGGRLDAVESEHLTAAAIDGDADALAVLDEFAWWVAVGLAGLVNALDPALVVLGGGLVAVGEPLLAPVRAHLARLVVGAGHRPEVPVVPASAGPASAAVGAALLGELDALRSGHQE